MKSFYLSAVTKILDRERSDTWPHSTSFADDKAYMLRAFLHLTGQIEGGDQHKIRICAANFYLGIKSSEVNLCCSKSLLSDWNTLR